MIVSGSNNVCSMEKALTSHSQIPVESVQHISEIQRCISATDPWTTMFMAHSCRVIMGPCRNGELLSIVALVPDGDHPLPPAFIFQDTG